MKFLLEKDYTYLGKDGHWYVFESKPKPNFYPERLYEYAAKFKTVKGETIYFNPVKK